MNQSFATAAARDAFAAFPQPARETLMSLRAMIYEIAATLPVGRIEESTKLGPAILHDTGYQTRHSDQARPVKGW